MRVADLPVGALERPAVRLVPEPGQDLELLLQHVHALAVRWIRNAVAGVLVAFQPAPTPTSTRPPLISSTVMATLANEPGMRNVTGETSAPSRIRGVSRARPGQR